MTEKWRTILFGGAVALGIAFIALGIVRGEMDLVLRQAITVCLECIGIG